MSFSDVQWEFTQDCARLVLYAAERGFKLTDGEAYRTRDQQLLYVHGKNIEPIGDTIELVSGPIRSKTMDSDHLHRLARDFNIFYDVDGDGGKDYTADKVICEQLGVYWESLNPKNYWGGRWGWDTPHFGRKV